MYLIRTLQDSLVDGQPVEREDPDHGAGHGDTGGERDQGTRAVGQGYVTHHKLYL